MLPSRVNAFFVIHGTHDPTNASASCAPPPSSPSNPRACFFCFSFLACLFFQSEIHGYGAHHRFGPPPALAARTQRSTTRTTCRNTQRQTLSEAHVSSLSPTALLFQRARGKNTTFCCWLTAKPNFNHNSNRTPCVSSPRGVRDNPHNLLAVGTLLKTTNRRHAHPRTRLRLPRETPTEPFLLPHTPTAQTMCSLLGLCSSSLDGGLITYDCLARCSCKLPRETCDPFDPVFEESDEQREIGFCSLPTVALFF